MTEIELLTYLLVFALSLIFTVFSVERKDSMFSFLSGFCWFMMAMIHSGLAVASIYIQFAYLFLALGLIFFVYGFVLIFAGFMKSKTESEWQVD